jgi:hypothetical protein
MQKNNIKIACNGNYEGPKVGFSLFKIKFQETQRRFLTMKDPI